MRLWTSAIVVMLAVGMLFAVGCQQQTEQAETAVEGAAERAVEAASDAVEAAGEVVEEAAEAVEKVGEEAKELVEGATEKVLTDPVCGMKVTEDAQHSLDYEGKTYYFCAETCLQKFVADPEKYVSAE